MLRISERYLIHGGLAHFFVAVARNDAYRNILDGVRRSKLCRVVPGGTFSICYRSTLWWFGMSWRPL
jgi:hypothetical protein